MPGANNIMLDTLQALRRAFEQERALGGSWYIALPEAADDAVGPAFVAVAPTATETDQPEDAAAVSISETAVMATKDLFGNPGKPSEDPSLAPSRRINALIPEDSPLREMSTLEEVTEYVQNTVFIPLDETRILPVMGVGNPDANLMIIGEAPGADEDRMGEPFVGRAGQLLNKILEAIHFSREEVYITNILKSRPPGNRDPLPEEIEAHIPILYKQISLIDPKIILCVGKTAGNALLGRRSSLGSLRDHIHDFYGIPLVVTYHPAALLRNPQWKRPTWEDVKLLRTRYDQLVKE